MTRFTHLNYANVMASIAVFIALSGTSYAAAKLTKDSVKTEQIKNGAIKRADLGKGAVTSGKVKDGSLLLKDFKPGQLPLTGNGGKGDKGEKGEKGEKGDPGVVDTSKFYSKSETDGRFLGKSAKAADADTLDGKDATDFVSGSGRQLSGHEVVASGHQASPFVHGEDLHGVALRLDCDTSNTRPDGTQVWIANFSHSPMPVWMDNGGAEATFDTLNVGGGYFMSGGVKTGDVPDHVTFRVLSGDRDLTLDVWSKRRSGNCVFAWDVRVD